LSPRGGARAGSGRKKGKRTSETVQITARVTPKTAGKLRAAAEQKLCTPAYRGVDTTIVFPARNDSWIVGAASRSYYADLLSAGVKIYEYQGGLLHTKSLTLDGEVTLIGSANMDRRSFELNYENNILFHDPALTGAVRERQQEYIARSNRVTKEAVAAWPMSRRLWNNLIATLGPVL
jgi:cardiolipin synthase A/B